MIATASRKAASRPLARDGGVALFREIYEHFRRAIADGQLAPGARLPSWLSD
jgi:DNA-binding GntR family transcriptional regulator